MTSTTSSRRAGSPTSVAETVFGISTALAGIGILTVALAPLAMPILILIIVSLLPLLAVGLVLALVATLSLAVLALLRPRLRHSDRPRRRVATAPPGRATQPHSRW